MGQDCLLCLAPSRAGPVCGECEDALPWIGQGCVRCGIALPIPGVCGDCLTHPPAFDDAIACFEYRYPVDRLIGRFKYGGDLAAGHWLAQRLADRLDSAHADWIVAPPLTSSRLRTRGFNQAMEIAKLVARRSHARCVVSAVRKLRETSPQPGLGRRERQANLRGAFACDARIEGLHVAVVDDVMTTGATADAIAAALKQAGAARVSAWTLARTPQPSR